MNGNPCMGGQFQTEHAKGLGDLYSAADKRKSSESTCIKRIREKSNCEAAQPCTWQPQGGNIGRGGDAGGQFSQQQLHSFFSHNEPKQSVGQHRLSGGVPFGGEIHQVSQPMTGQQAQPQLHNFASGFGEPRMQVPASSPGHCRCPQQAVSGSTVGNGANVDATGRPRSQAQYRRLSSNKLSSQSCVSPPPRQPDMQNSTYVSPTYPLPQHSMNFQGSQPGPTPLRPSPCHGAPSHIRRASLRSSSGEFNALPPASLSSAPISPRPPSPFPQHTCQTSLQHTCHSSPPPPPLPNLSPTIPQRSSFPQRTQSAFVDSQSNRAQSPPPPPATPPSPPASSPQKDVPCAECQKEAAAKMSGNNQSPITCSNAAQAAAQQKNQSFQAPPSQPCGGGGGVSSPSSPQPCGSGHAKAANESSCYEEKKSAEDDCSPLSLEQNGPCPMESCPFGNGNSSMKNNMYQSAAATPMPQPPYIPPPALDRSGEPGNQNAAGNGCSGGTSGPCKACAALNFPQISQNSGGGGYAYNQGGQQKYGYGQSTSQHKMSGGQNQSCSCGSASHRPPSQLGEGSCGSASHRTPSQQGEGSCQQKRTNSSHNCCAAAQAHTEPLANKKFPCPQCHQSESCGLN